MAVQSPFRHGADGDDGDDGNDGDDGADGATWHSGANVPGSTLGNNGDFYFRTSNTTVYSKSNGAWSVLSSLAGSDGATWHTGTIVPVSTLGNNGDFYFKSDDASIWSKTAGAWAQQIEIHDGDDGDDGTDGATWHSGTGVPANDLGAQGDFYFQTSNGYVYEKTGATAWTFQRDITGPQGLQGVQGIQGTAPALPVLTTPPPAPTGLYAVGGPGFVILSWPNPFRVYSNHAYTEIWSNTVDQLSSATKLGNASFAVYADDDPAVGITYYYWIRYVTTSDVLGVFSASVTAASRAVTNDGITGIAAAKVTGLQAAFNELTVNTANIADGAIINALIGNVIKSANYDGVDSPTSSEEGQIGTTGWLINKNGKQVISLAYVRGTLSADHIDSDVINSRVIFDGESGDINQWVLSVPFVINEDDWSHLLCMSSSSGMAGIRVSDIFDSDTESFRITNDSGSTARFYVAIDAGLAVESTDISSVVANAYYAYLDSNGDYVVLSLVGGTPWDIYLLDGDNLTNTTAPYGLKGRTPGLTSSHTVGLGNAEKTFMDGRDLVTIGSDEVVYKIDVDNPTGSVESTDISSVVANAYYAYLDSNGDYVVLSLVGGTPWDIYLLDGDNLTNTTAPYGLKGRTPGLTSSHTVGLGNAEKTFMDGRDLVTIGSDEVVYKIDVDNPTGSVESTDISSVVANAYYAYLDSNGDYVVLSLVGGTPWDIYLLDGDNLTNTTAPYGLKGRTPGLTSSHTVGLGNAEKTFMDGRDLVTIGSDEVVYKIDVPQPGDEISRLSFIRTGSTAFEIIGLILLKAEA